MDGLFRSNFVDGGIFHTRHLAKLCIMEVEITTSVLNLTINDFKMGVISRCMRKLDMILKAFYKPIISRCHVLQRHMKCQVFISNVFFFLLELGY